MNNDDRRIVPHNQPIPVKVTFTAPDGEKVEYYMNYNNPTSVKKLTKSLKWALTNGRKVMMVETSQEESQKYYDSKHSFIESVIITSKGEVISGGNELLEQVAG